MFRSVKTWTLDAHFDQHATVGPPPSDIAIWRYGGMGDTLLTAPLLQVLRDTYPDARIHFYGHRHALEFLEHTGLVDTTEKLIYNYAGWIPPLDTVGTHWGLLPEIQQQLRDYLHGSQMVFSFNLARERSSTALERLEIPNWVSGGALPWQDVHQADYMLAAAEMLGIAIPERQSYCFDVDLPFPKDLDFDPTCALLFAPGSHENSAYKAWPLDRFRKAVQSLAAIHDLDPVPVLGLFERDWLPDWKGPVLRMRTLSELAPILQLCPLFLGNDSGITHFASLMGAPTLAIFGPTDPTCWRPYGPRTTVHRQCQTHGRAVGKIGKWEPDGVRVCADKKCMERIDWQAVVAQAGRMLA